VGGRFLPRLDADGLCEHVEGNGFMSRLEFAITAKAMHVLQETLPARIAARKIGILSEASREAQVRRRIPGVAAMRTKVALAMGDGIVQSGAMNSSAGDARASRLTAAGSRSRATSNQFVPLSRLRKLRECEQVVAVCYRMRGSEIEFLLVRTRGGNRWTFPKGSAEPGLTHAQAAALEAFEEAGVHGRIEEAAFARYARRRACEGSYSVNAHLCEVLRLSAPKERNRKRTWFSVEDAKTCLRERRQHDDGVEFVRVIDRAVARIQRLRGGIGMVDVRPQQDRPGQKDGLQRVQFEALADGYGIGYEHSAAAYVRRRLNETRQSVAPDLQDHGREILHGEVLQFGLPGEQKAKALGSGTKNG
jgi:8-oxo-dGTP pyrophosphatase MutT (NUDIX family)